MKKATDPGINFFQRYLTVWVFLCMVVGVLLGHFLPTLPAFRASEMSGKTRRGFLLHGL